MQSTVYQLVYDRLYGRTLTMRCCVLARRLCLFLRFGFSAPEAFRPLRFVIPFWNNNGVTYR